MNLRILGAREIRELLPMSDCIAATRQAMTLTSTGRAEQPIRTKMDVPGRKGLMSMMPGAIEGRTSPSGITMFKSLGMISEDLTSADAILRSAAARNMGTVVDF